MLALPMVMKAEALTRVHVNEVKLTTTTGRLGIRLPTDQEQLYALSNGPTQTSFEFSFISHCHDSDFPSQERDDDYALRNTRKTSPKFATDSAY